MVEPLLYHIGHTKECANLAQFVHTVELKNLCAVHRTIVVKLPLLRAVWAGQGSILRFVILMEFFLGPWLDVCQFVEISNQMESNGEVTSIERIFLYNAALYNFFLLNVRYFASWLYLIGNVYKLAHYEPRT